MMTLTNPVLRNSADRYAGAVVAMHWLMLVLVAAVYASIELRELFPKGSDPREALKVTHFTLGLCVLLLIGARFGLRLLAGPAPGITPAPPAWQHKSGALMHVALYALMIVLPLAGWLLLSAKGKSIPFGLPPLVDESETLAEWIEEVHEIGGTIGYWLIGLHAAAALFHHYLRRDNTLARMLPRPRRGGASQPSR